MVLKTKKEQKKNIKRCRNITYYFIRKIVFSTPTTIPMRGMPFMGDYTKVWTDKDYCDYFNLDYNKKEINLGTEDMKFDVIAMNPPYGKLHLPFLELCTKLRNDGGEIISIQPIDKLQTNVQKIDLSWLKPEHIKIIKSIDATKLFNFNAKFVSDLGIIHITDNHNFDISELKYYNNYYNKINKLRKKSLHDHYSKIKSGEHFVEFALTHGNVGTLTVYELFSATRMEVNKECKARRKSDKRRLYFNTKIEAENFIKSCRNITYYFMRRIGLSTTTTIPMKFMPFMDDYTKVWTDKDYCDYFNLDYDIVKKEMGKYIKQVKKSYPDYEPNI